MFFNWERDVHKTQYLVWYLCLSPTPTDMEATSKEARLRNIVVKGLEHLFEKLTYGQKNVLNKFGTLGYQLTASALSKIKNEGEVGFRTLNQSAKYMQEVLQLELGMIYSSESQDFVNQDTPDWKAYVIPERTNDPDKSPSFLIHVNGRVSIQEKTQFIAEARKEVLEIGVRLNSYTNYFISQSDKAFKAHIVALLRKGVSIKSYLLDPDSQEARIYFDDRAKVQTFEKDAITETKRNMERLKALCAEFEAMHLAGTFEIFLYRHIPFSQILVVDSKMEGAKMMVSNYLYGVKRADCPVIEFSKTDRPQLFSKYWESFQHFVSGAVKLE